MPRLSYSSLLEIDLFGIHHSSFTVYYHDGLVNALRLSCLYTPFEQSFGFLSVCIILRNDPFLPILIREQHYTPLAFFEI